MNKWGYIYLNVLIKLWEKEKLLVMSNFSFSHNVFKSRLLLICQNEYLWRKGLRQGRGGPCRRRGHTTEAGICQGQGYRNGYSFPEGENINLGETDLFH